MGTTSSKISGDPRRTQTVMPKTDNAGIGPMGAICHTPTSSTSSAPGRALSALGLVGGESASSINNGGSMEAPFSMQDATLGLPPISSRKEGVEAPSSYVPDSPGDVPGSLRAKHRGSPRKGMAPSQSDGEDERSAPRSAAAAAAPGAMDPRQRMMPAGPRMPESWQRGDTIGTGSFGSVFLGLNNGTGELLAVKEVAVNVDAHKMKESVEQLESEVELLSQLNHPNIVKYVGTLRQSKRLFIFLEYVPGGSISGLLTRFGPLNESVIRVYTRQILKGLAYLHSMRTVHRDIKGANLLVEKNGRVKLADFGMAKQMVEHMSFTRSFKGSAFWMAPEVIRQRGHGVAADIWSVGCTVLEMATGNPPWSQCSTQVQAIFKIASSQELPTIPESLSPQAAEFILLCLQRDPAARPKASDLLNHPFVALRPGEEEHPTYMASDEYGMSEATPNPVGQTREDLHANSAFGEPAARLPHVEEGDEEALSYGSSRSRQTSSRAGSYGGGGGDARTSSVRTQRVGGDQQGRMARSSNESYGSDGDVTNRSGVTPEQSEAGSFQPEGSPLKRASSRKSKRGKSSKSGSSRRRPNDTSNLAGNLDDSYGSPARTRRVADADRTASGECTPKTPPIGEESQDFTSQPQQFRVKGLLGLPQLKMHANTGSAHLTLPPLAPSGACTPSSHHGGGTTPTHAP